MGKIETSEPEIKTNVRSSEDGQHSFGVLSRDNKMDPQAGNATWEGIKEFIDFVRKNKERLDECGERYTLTYTDDAGWTQEVEINDESQSAEAIADKAHGYAQQGNLVMSVSGDACLGAQRILDSYYKVEMTQAETEDKKLNAVAKCVIELERLHLFRDANCRTLVLVLNKLLMQNVLKPVILKNPNVIEFYSTHQLVDEIKLGQKCFEKSCITRAKKFIQETVGPIQAHR